MPATDLSHKAAEVIGQLQIIAPQAAQVALDAVRADAYSDLFLGILAGVALAGDVWVFRKVYVPWLKSDSADDVLQVFAGLVLAIAGVAFGITVIVGLLNPWTYITIAHPELRIAHDIITAAHN